MKDAENIFDKNIDIDLLQYGANNAPDGIFLLDKKGKIIWVNENAYDKLGYDREELIGKNILEIDPNFSEDNWGKHWKEIKKQGQATIESHHIKKDGTQLPVELSINHLNYKDREIHLTFVRDISERKKTEKTLKNKHRHLQNLFSNLPGIAYRCKSDEEWTMEFVSEGSKKLTGYTPEELIDNSGISFNELIHPKDREKVSKKVQHAMEEKEHFEVEYRLITKDKEEKWVWERGKYVNSQEESKKIEGLITDITERKQKERKLRKNKKKYKGLFESVQVAIVELNSEGEIISANSFAEKSLGLPEEKLIEKGLDYWQGMLYKENGQPMDIKEFPVSQVYNTKQSYENSILGMSQSQTTDISWYIVSAIPQFDKEGDIERVITSFKDITKRIKMEESLKENEKKYRTVVENTGAATVIIEEDRTISLVNKRFEELSGYSREKIEGKKYWTEFVIDEDLDRMKEYHRKRRTGQESMARQTEFRFIDKKGKIHNIVLNVESILDTDKAVSSLVDITEKKKMEQQLKKSEEKYRAVFENTGTATVIVEKDTTISLVNEKFEDLSGYSRDEVEGVKNWTEFVAKEDLPKLKKYFQQRVDNNIQTHKNLEFKFIDKNDDIHYTIFAEDNIPNTNKYITSLTDITERKEIEQRLKESEKRYRRLVETTGDIIFIHDKDGLIKFANQSALEFSGYDQEEVIGENITKFLPDSELDSFLKRKNKRLEEQNKERFHFETIFANKNGEQIEVDIQETPQFQNGEYKQSLIVARDISERKQAEEEKKQLREQLYQKHKLESIGTLAGGIAHDFNNLLTVIIGMSELGINQTQQEKHKSTLKEIREAGKKAASLTEQLLLYSREKKTEFTILNLNEVINNLHTMLKRLISEDINIT